MRPPGGKFGRKKEEAIAALSQLFSSDTNSRPLA
jgi:hypothetical protein